MTAAANLGVAFHGGRGELLVLLHGIDSTSEQWRPAGVALARKNEVVILDLLGFGRSPMPLASSEYAVERHARAVWVTLDRLAPGKAIRFAGHGFGAIVAMACAGQRPDSVREVIAFSPTLLPPASDADRETATRELDETLGELRRKAGEPLARALMAEPLEARLLPRIASQEALFSTDSEELLAEAGAPLVLVVPDADTRTPKAWLRRWAAGRPDASIVTTEGGPLLPFEDPEAAAKLIEPGSEEVLKAARREVPVAVRQPRRFSEVLAGTSSLAFRQAVLAAALGLAFVVWNPTAPRFVSVGLTVWLLLEAIQSVAGAFGLAGRGRPWVGWLLGGVVSFGFALALTAQDALGLTLGGAAVAAWLALRALADFYLVVEQRETAGPRALLLVRAGLGIVAATLAWSRPDLGDPYLRYLLGGYLVLTGGLLLAYAMSLQRAAIRRLKRLAEGG